MAGSTDARARYLSIAARHFAERGFHGVSLAALAAEAGVTKQAFLHFFGTKERLYAEVLAALAKRLLAEVENAPGVAPEDRLLAYFEARAEGALLSSDDARLVVRALLESDAAARTWPLKPYLERLAGLLRATPRWNCATEAEALAALYSLIGSAQYLAISGETLRGMFGETADGIAAAHRAGLRRTVRSIIAEGPVSPPSPPARR